MRQREKDEEAGVINIQGKKRMRKQGQIKRQGQQKDKRRRRRRQW